MRKIYLLLVAAVSFALLPGYAAERTAQEIIDRYVSVSGFDRSADMTDQSIFMEMSVVTQGVEVALKGVVCYPLKMRFEMSMMGQDMLMVLNGKKGWMIAGGTKQPLPARQVEQLAKQNDILANLKFDSDHYDFTLLEPATKNGVLYDVVKAVPKLKDVQIKEQVIYFDHETGFISNARNVVEQDGNRIEVEVTYGEIKEFGMVKMPGRIVTIAQGIAPTEITIKNIEFDYPAEEWMFVEPQ